MITLYQLSHYAGHVCRLKRPGSLINQVLTTVIFFMVALGNAPGQTYPASFSQVQVASGLNSPTAMAFAPDGRIFVAQQGGALRVIKNGTLLSTPFIQLDVDSNGERGLIGIVLDPAFPTNKYIYLYHTVPGTPAHNRISRYTANGDVMLAGSEVVILDLDPLGSATNHNGGPMVFGKDGKLYVGVGENAIPDKAQDLDTHLGKILRINADGSAPADNPFSTGSEQRKRVWAFGLRNPYTLAVQPNTGRFFVNDVGQGSAEEINDATTKGLNFGWPNAEGTSSNAAYANPVYSYPHGSGDGKGCAITGGTFFNPSATNYPVSMVGKYFYQDFCNNWINYIDFEANPVNRSAFATDLPNNSLSISTGLDGNLYFLSIGAGALYKLMYSPPLSDLTPSIVLPQSNFAVSGENSIRSFTVNLFETAGYNTSSGNISITITAPLGFTLAYNNTLTSINVSGGTKNPVAVDNTKWTVTNSASNRQLTLTINAGQSIVARGTAALGFTITRTQANSGNTSNIGVNITADPALTYDSNPINNIYARIINSL